ncbi:MAG: hypothetical protein PQJ46_07005 [Spirochaetales bacterium]|nr:hypothetical protein [Spirochaetales bacterium]
MAEIKSALELALEKTEGIKVDKERLQAKELKIKGRKAALAFLDSKTDAKELKKEMKHCKGKEQEAFMDGAGTTFLSYLKLPTDENYKEEVLKAGEGIAAISDNSKDVQQMFEQLVQFLDQYVETKGQIETQLKAQFEPLLKQKEDALEAQTGTRISIDPMDDPQFQQAYTQNMGQLQQNYVEALNNAKEQLKQFIGMDDQE